MRFAEVILDIATQALDRAYTYTVPHDMADAHIGCAVLVPFGGRVAVGFIMSLRDFPDECSDEIEAFLGFSPARAKSITRVLSSSFFDEAGAKTARFIARHYIAPLSACVRLFVPPGGVPRVVQVGKSWRLEQARIGEIDDRWVRLLPSAESFSPRKQAVKQRAILSALSEGELSVADLTAEYGAVNATIKALVDRGVIEVFSKRRMRTPDLSYELVSLHPESLPILTAGQTQALTTIEQAYEQAAGHVVVLDGVTGSGKTEVYLRAIERIVRQGQTAIVLVPEISLTPQTVARFRGRFGDLVAVLHSRMSDGERFDQWDFIRSGAARVVVGARSALFAPLRDIGLIVIDEEHESSYKQDSAPRYVARDVAAWMVKERKATLVLGSATPSVEALWKCSTDEHWKLVELSERANGRPLPSIQIVDMAHEFSDGSRSMFSRKLISALEETLRAQRKAVLLLNQRGFAQFVLCRACGHVPLCPDCSTSLTFHESTNKLVCHHCGYQITTPALCPVCQSPYLKKFGAGTQRVEAELRKVISSIDGLDAHIVRMDADTTARKGAHQKLLEEFASAEAAVLLGTQMIAKGLDFDDVVLVGVINADTQLRLPDFRAQERTFDLIEQVAGRAGRASLPGIVIVQTYSAQEVAIRAAARYDRDLWLEQELHDRKLLGYPPYTRLADVRIWGKQEQEVINEAQELYQRILEAIEAHAQSGWTVLLPSPCVLARLRGSYRYHITIKAPVEADFAEVLTEVFRTRKPHPRVHATIDIDAINLL